MSAQEKRVIPCPLPDFPAAWIELPAAWIGKHAELRDTAVEQAQAKGMKQTAVSFAIAMRLLETWGGIPGLDGNPDKWDFSALDLSLIAWISDTVLEAFGNCFLSHRRYSRLLLLGLTKTAATPPGNSETAESEPE